MCQLLAAHKGTIDWAELQPELHQSRDQSDVMSPDIKWQLFFHGVHVAGTHPWVAGISTWHSLIERNTFGKMIFLLQPAFIVLHQIHKNDNVFLIIKTKFYQQQQKAQLCYNQHETKRRQWWTKKYMLYFMYMNKMSKGEETMM
jgi:hypothetical protein